MAIQINKVQGSVPVSDKKITYRDLELDLKETAIPTVDKQYGRVSRTDLKQSLDESAILNSIKNICYLDSRFESLDSLYNSLSYFICSEIIQRFKQPSR